jgi:hypothetical protein
MVKLDNFFSVPLSGFSGCSNWDVCWSLSLTHAFLVFNLEIDYNFDYNSYCMHCRNQICDIQSLTAAT